MGSSRGVKWILLWFLLGCFFHLGCHRKIIKPQVSGIYCHVDSQRQVDTMANVQMEVETALRFIKEHPECQVILITNR